MPSIKVANPEKKVMKEAMFYERLDNKKVRCCLCPHNCIIENKKRGICNVRENREGILYSLVFEYPCSIAVDPIEKKPLFHFFPGEKALSLGTVGCNMKCLNCQNYDISTADPKDYNFQKKTPDYIVKEAKKNKCSIIAYTYTEPTIFYEYVLECAKLAKRKGIKNIAVTNGYINPEPAKKLYKYIDAANIDIKGFDEKFYKNNCSARLKPVLETIKLLHSMNVWIEITNLIIPGLNDSQKSIKDMCLWIKDNVGFDVPLHFTAFYPCYKLINYKATTPEILEKARKIALEIGLRYVYTGNIIDSEGNSTFCPNCKKTVIKRTGFGLQELNIKKNACSFCKTKIGGCF